MSIVGLSATNQTFVLVQQEEGGVEGYDGVLGLPPTPGGYYTLKNGSIPKTIPDDLITSLYRQGRIPKAVFGVWLDRPQYYSIVPKNGEIALGGWDTARFSGNLKWIDMVAAPGSTSGLARYLVMGGFKVGTTKRTIKSATATDMAVLDTGANVIAMDTAAVTPIVSITGTTDTFDCKLKASMPNVTFVFNGTDYTLTPDDYVATIDTTTCLLLIVPGMTDSSTAGLNWSLTILGTPFLRKFYSVYDSTASQIGLAPAVFNANNVTGTPVSDGSPSGARSSSESPSTNGANGKEWGSGVMTVVALLMAMTLLV
ncbi:hypothetical protein HDV00_010225 [Rhizophlyctis rosea]|nr:hypothetical protein HDV00_010225 [Rhizophlyctis rosea]